MRRRHNSFSNRRVRWAFLRQVLKFYETMDLAYMPMIQLEQLDYRRSLDARPTVGQMKAFLNQSRLNFCDIGARGEIPPELIGFEDLLSLILFEPELDAADSLSARWGDRAQIHRIAVGPIGRRKFLKTKIPGCSSLLDPNGAGRLHLQLVQGNYAFSKIQIVHEFDVECQPLSQAVEFEITPIDILKVDAQGFDYEILTTLGLHRPFVIKVEVSTVPIYDGQRTLGVTLEYLEKIGYMAVKLPFAKPHVYAHSRRGTSISVGDLVAVPDCSKRGRSIIRRDPIKWRAALMLFGFSDLANHQDWIFAEHELEMA